MLKEWLKMKNMHFFFPTATAIICGILIVVVLIQRALKCKKENKPFFNFKNYHFFTPGYDRVKLWGSLILFALYIFLLPKIHFIAAGIIFVTLFNILYTNCINLEKLFGQKNSAGYAMPMFNVKDLLISVAIAVIFSVGLWLLFFKVFNITLP